MNILLLNLTRFGDLLQSQAAITELHMQGHTVGVVCLQNFAGAVNLLQHVTFATSLPGSTFLRYLASPDQQQEVGAGWANALAELHEWRTTLANDFSYDVVCNITPTLSSRLLARYLAENKAVTGFGVDTTGFGYCSSSWGAFLQGASAIRGVSPFNIVDLFRKIIATN